MLKDVLNQELSDLKISRSECVELEEAMAGGAGCRGSSCSGTCTTNSKN